MTKGTREAAEGVLRRLRYQPATKPELAGHLGTSETTVQRALDWMRSIGVPIFFSRTDIVEWKLGDCPEWEGLTLADLVAGNVITKEQAQLLACEHAEPTDELPPDPSVQRALELVGRTHGMTPEEICAPGVESRAARVALVYACRSAGIPTEAIARALGKSQVSVRDAYRRAKKNPPRTKWVVKRLREAMQGVP